MISVRIGIRLLLALVLLTAGLITVPATFGDAKPVLADNDDDDDNGQGNQGRGRGRGQGQGQGRGRGNNEERGKPVNQAATYRVDAECSFDQRSELTTCEFSSVSPVVARDIRHVDLPESEVCAEVVGGNHDYVNPDPDTRVVGYQSRGSRGWLTIEFVGPVTTGGTATYWLKTNDGVFPATGPGLICGDDVAPPEAGTTTDEPIVVVLEPAPSPQNAAVNSGAVMVQTYACAEDSPSAGFDWYGECEPGVEGIRFTLSAAETSPMTFGRDTVTDATGRLYIEEIDPNTYALDSPDVDWCYAESDSVNEHGWLEVESGTDTRVWIFLCGAQPTK